MANQTYRLAVLGAWGGHDNVLVDYETVTDELLWVRSDGRFPVPENCDLPVKRYQLRKNKISGKEAFYPIVHEKDAAEENVKPSVQVNPGFVARALLALNSGEKLSEQDEAKLKEWLSSVDAQGSA